MINTNTTPHPATTYISITPSQAIEWLKQNTINRKLDKVTVEKYRRDMQAGRWNLTHEGIAFDTDGVIVDGQHRLHAIAQIDDGFSLTLPVTFGLAPVSRKFVDQGKKREAAGNLQMAGVRHASNNAAAARLVILLETGLIFRDNQLRRMITVPQIEEWVEENMEKVERANDNHRLILATNATPSVSRAAFIILSGIDYEAAVKFFHALGSGANLRADDPIYALRSRLLSIATKKVRKPTVRDELGAFFKAWNLWRSGKSRRTPIETHGYTADRFPEPK